MPSSPIVQTDKGPVVGSTTGPVHVFRGIPYARPPVGELRWRPPEEPRAWTGPLDASRFGPIAPQNPSHLEQLFGAQQPEQSEACLSLNVWTPLVRATVENGAGNAHSTPRTRRSVAGTRHGAGAVGALIRSCSRTEFQRRSTGVPAAESTHRRPRDTHGLSR